METVADGPKFKERLEQKFWRKSLRKQQAIQQFQSAAKRPASQ